MTTTPFELNKNSIQTHIQQFVKTGKTTEAGLLKMILAEIQNREAKGNVTSADIEAIVRHQIKSIQGMIDMIGKEHPKSVQGQKEINFYETLVPKLLRDDEIKVLVERAIRLMNATSKSDRGKVKNSLQNHPGIDMQVVTRYVCDLLP